MKFYKVALVLHGKQEIQWIDTTSKYNTVTNINSRAPLESLTFLEAEVHNKEEDGLPLMRSLCTRHTKNLKIQA